MNLELLSHDNEARRAEAEARRAEADARWAQIEERNAQVTDQINSLLQVAHLHNESLKAHLGRIETLEGRR